MIVDLGLGWATGFDVPWPIYVVIPGLCCLVVAIVDGDGWAIRTGIAHVALEQRRRWPGRSMPVTPGAAVRWLVDPANSAATVVERVSVLTTAGRYAEAGEALRDLDPVDALGRVRILRLKAAIAAAIDPDAEINLDRIRQAAAELPPDESRYHVLSGAWSRAFLDVTRRRPWRSRFAAVAREHAPYALPRRVRVALAVQQLAAPLAFLLSLPIVALFLNIVR